MIVLEVQDYCHDCSSFEKVDIVNAFQGQEAADIYRKLITVKKGGINGTKETGK